MVCSGVGIEYLSSFLAICAAEVAKVGEMVVIKLKKRVFVKLQEHIK
jgi:hypothetical protein